MPISALILSLSPLSPRRRILLFPVSLGLAAGLTVSAGSLQAQAVPEEPAADAAEVTAAEVTTAETTAAETLAVETAPEDVAEEAPDGTSLEDRAHREVEELHQFFEDWFNGEAENTDEAYARFSDVLADGFVIIVPSGQLQDRDTLVEGLRPHYAPEGSEPIRLWIENFQLRLRFPGEDGDVVLVTYEQWQQRGESRRGRLSSALLRERADTPNGLEWLHVHETWLPNR